MKKNIQNKNIVHWYIFKENLKIINNKNKYYVEFCRAIFIDKIEKTLYKNKNT